MNSMQVRQRACLCPAPKTPQEQCDGESFQIRECMNVPVCGQVVVSSQDRNEGSGIVGDLNTTSSIPEVKIDGNK